MELRTWLVWSDDMGETLDVARPIRAVDAETAATEYAELSFNDEPWDGEMGISARLQAGGQVEEFRVEPEQVITFNVRAGRA